MLISNLEHREKQKSYVAVGAFDGVHLAHQEVISHVVKGKEKGFKSVVITFKSITEIKHTRQLMTEQQRMRALSSFGVDEVYECAFEELRDYTPERFIKEILKDVCNAEKVFVGYNFHFGKGGVAGADCLKKLCNKYDIEYEIIPEYMVDNMPVSSTRIRKLIAEGDIEKANELLGEPFAVEGEVVHGKKLGRTIGVPTINIPASDKMAVPKFGVYATYVTVDGKRYIGVTNVGDNPTVKDVDIKIETWIQEFSGDIYGKEVTVEFLHYIREVQKFSSLDELKTQIHKDRDKVLSLLK